MATTREQFIALRKSGMTPVQAKEEVMKTVTPVSPTTNANVAQLEANKAKVQSQIASWERPEVGTSVTPQAGQTQAPTPTTPPPAPVTPTATPNGASLSAEWTVTPAPISPIQTEQDLNNKLGWVIQQNGLNSVQPLNAKTIMPATPKADPTPWITQDAFQQAKSESEKIKAQNDAIMAQNKQKSDLAREDLKLATDQKTAEAKQAQDQANTALANDENAILTTLKTGWMIPESVKSSPFYKSAQQTYNKLQQYSTYSTSEMVTAMNQGSIVPWTNVYNEMMKDPAMKQKLTDAQVYRAGNPVNSTQIYENASSEIMSNNPTTANYLADGVITQDEYNQATNNTEVVAKAKEVEEKANKYNTLKAEYDSIEDEVNAQFPWSPFADSIIADRQKAKYKNLVLAKWEWETSTGTLTELKSQASTLFETNLNLAETRRAEQNQIASEQRKIQAEKDMMQYEADFNKKQAEEALKDPATAIKSVMDEYKKLGIPFTSTVQSRIAEFKASGKPLEQFLTEMGQNIQQSPAYQKYQALQQGQMSDVQKMDAQNAFDLKKMAQQNNFDMQKLWVQLQASWWTKDASGNLVNPVTGQTFNGSMATIASTTWNIVPVTIGNKTVRLDQSGATGFESAVSQLATAWIPIVVWQGARDQISTIQSMASQYGIPFNSSNPAETAQKLRSAGHQVADPWKSNHETGMAIDVYGSGKLDAVTPAQEKILNANGWYSANIPGDAGHFEYRWKGSWNTITTWNFSQKAIDLGQNILSGDAKLSDISGKSNEALKVEVMQYIANKNKTTQNTNVSQIQDTIKLIDSITNHPWLTSAVWAKSLFTNPLDYSLPSSDAAWFKAKLEQLTAANFMVGIKSMKWLGALSDAEGSKVSASVSSLANRDQWEAEYKAELQRLRDVLTNRLTSTEKETGIKYDANGFAIDPTQQQSNTAPVAVQDILSEWNNRK